MKRILFLLGVTALILLGSGSAKAVTYSGRVTDGGVGVGGVTITYTWSGPTGSVTTDGNGNWSSGGWVSGFAVTFTATQTGYSFSAPRNYTTPLLAVSGVDFTRTSYSISGSVKRGGVGVEGVTVALGGAMSGTTTTAASGNYSFVRLRTGSYTITPTRADTDFSPANRSVTLNPSQPGQDFTVFLPTATTLPATNIAFGRARLRGTFEGDGTRATEGWFENGAGFSEATPRQSFGPGSAPVVVSEVIAGFSAATVHNFRFVTANESGTNVGNSLQFVMPYPEAATALSFDGTDDYVNAESGAHLKMTNRTTWEAWIYPTRPLTAATKRDTILGREGEYLLGRSGDGGIIYALRVGGTWTWRSAGVTVPNNQWSHVAFSFNGTTPRVYVNGSPFAIPNLPGAIGDAIPDQNEFRIGGRQGAGESFQGQIDEVRIWNVVKSDSEIADKFDHRVSGKEPGLVGYFRFNEGSGSSTTDSSPWALTAKVSGALFTESGALIRDAVAETLPASPVLATRATLQATINPSGEPTAVRFQFGETLAYGSTTEGQDLAAGLSPVAISVTLTNLQPGTTYHYRVVAENSAGLVVGENQSFTTLVLGVGWPTSAKVTGGFSASPKHVVDAQGNAYLAGQFFGSATFKTTMVSSNGTPDVFVGKLSRGANWNWNNRVTLGVASAISVNAIAIDETNNVYIAGQFTGSATFGNAVLNAAGVDAFVAKLNSDGETWLWARAAGGGQSDSANGLAVTPRGSVFLTGHFNGVASFGTNNLVSNGGSQDLFVAKLDTDGSWIWARGVGGPGANDSGQAIVLNSGEDLFVTGRFQGAANFGSIALASSGVNDTDLFVASINKDGLWLLARRAGSSSDDSGTGLAIDGGGQIYLLGQFGGVADYDTLTPNLNEGGGSNLFVAKLSSSAALLWYAQGGAGLASSIAVDKANHVYVTGDFAISTKFSSKSVAFNLVSGGNSDVFLASIDAEFGVWNWAKGIGSTGSEARGSVGVDEQGGVVLSGSFQNTVPLGHVLLSTSNARDIFIARFDHEGIAEHNNYVIGQALPIPADAQNEDGGAIGQPSITILENGGSDNTPLNSFVWGAAERKLYPVRPVTAIVKWPLTTIVTNTTAVATAVGRTLWPTNPQIHIAKAPVDFEPAVAGFPYRYLNISYTTVPGASVDASSKRFTAGQPGWSVVQFLESGGEQANPQTQSSKFEVIKSVAWNDEAHLIKNQLATIGAPILRNVHSDPTGKNGFVYFENAFYDGAGEDRAYDRSTRSGPIIPVNENTGGTNEELVVVWYRTNLVTGIAWPSLPTHYVAEWPASPEQLALANGNGSGPLSAATYRDKRVYNQPDPALPGYNPNEEHAALYGDTLYALRDDLNAIVGVSKPYTLLKYRDLATKEWAYKVYKVVATDANSQFTYEGKAGQLLQLPPPLSLLSQCGGNNLAVSGPAFKDYLGRLHAQAAGTIVTRYWYPLQAGFFYDLDRDKQPDAQVGACIPWLDRRPDGTKNVPIDVSYNITWPQDAPTMQIGETLFNAKSGLPDLRNFANARVIFDEGNPSGESVDAITRLFDPLAPRTLQLRPANATDFITGPGYAVVFVNSVASLFEGISTATRAGLVEFSDLPYTLRSRLQYDPLKRDLIFKGFLDESQESGGPQDPLLLPNVLGARERDRIQALKNDETFNGVIEALYDLTRNPNRLDLDKNGQPDRALLVGLTTNAAGEAMPETLGDVPKILTAGNARRNGYITLVENDDASLGGLPVTLHVIRVENGPNRGGIKVIESDNVFEEKLTLRHSGDFGGEPDNFEFEWY